MREQKDFGLLILRGAGILLAGTFGIQKIGWYWSAFHAGKSLSSAGLAPVDREDGFSNPGRARFVDHVQRINRRDPYWMRLSDTITSGKRRARNGGGTLYQRSTRRRLAQGGALLDRLHGLSLNRSRQIFCGSSSPAQEVPRAKS